MEEIRQAYDYQNFTLREYRSISQIMLKYALENGNAVYLLRTKIEELRKQKIILPAMTTLQRMVWEARQRSEEKISKLLISSLTPEQIEKLDRILSPMPESSKTYLAWLSETPIGEEAKKQYGLKVELP